MNPTITQTENPLRIFGWKADNAGCGFYRIQQPLASLARMGHDVAGSTDMSPEQRDASQVIIGQRISKPPIVALWKELARRGNHFLVYEMDDNLFSIDPSNVAAYDFFMKPSVRQGIIDALRVSNLVIVTTQALYTAVYKYNKNVAIIPNYISAKALDLAPRNEVPVVGWAGSGTHGMDFAWEAPGLQAFFAEHPEIPFHTVGQDYTAMSGAKITWANNEWINSVPDYYDLLNFDIGLALVKPHPFNAAKSHIKALEYGARGIPVVASDYVTYQGYVQDGVTGFLASGHKRLPEALRTLVNDADLRHAMGDAGRALAEQNTMDGNVWRYEEAIQRGL